MIMKRLILTLVVVLAAVVSIHAKDGDQITLEAGTAKVIRNISSAYLKTYFKKATVEDKTWDEWLQMKGDDFVKDWPDDQKAAETEFMMFFNKKTKKHGGVKLQNTDASDRYHMEIHLKDIDMGSVGGGVVASVFLGAFAKKSGGVNFKDGYVDIIDTQQRKIVCRLSFKDVKGDNGFSIGVMIMNAFDDLSDEIDGFVERFGDQTKDEIAIRSTAAKKTAPVKTVTVEDDSAEAEAAPVAKNTATAAAKKTATTAKKGTAAAKKTATTTAAKTTSTAASSTGKYVSVTLNSGATINGKMKSLDPLSDIVIEVAGQTTSIPMSEVNKIEDK